jgi:hypothetical protein
MIATTLLGGVAKDSVANWGVRHSGRLAFAWLLMSAQVEFPNWVGKWVQTGLVCLTPRNLRVFGRCAGVPQLHVLSHAVRQCAWGLQKMSPHSHIPRFSPVPKVVMMRGKGGRGGTQICG